MKKYLLIYVLLILSPKGYAVQFTDLQKALLTEELEKKNFDAAAIQNYLQKWEQKLYENALLRQQGLQDQQENGMQLEEANDFLNRDVSDEEFVEVLDDAIQAGHLEDFFEDNLLQEVYQQAHQEKDRRNKGGVMKNLKDFGSSINRTAQEAMKKFKKFLKTSPALKAEIDEG